MLEVRDLGVDIRDSFRLCKGGNGLTVIERRRARTLFVEFGPLTSGLSAVCYRKLIALGDLLHLSLSIT